MITRLLQPSPLRSFALKALGIFLLWYVLYELWLLPDGRLDHWVALRVIDGAALVTRLFGFEVWMHDRVVTIAGNIGIEMVDGCTGISAIGLFLGFVWAGSRTEELFLLHRHHSGVQPVRRFWFAGGAMDD